MVFSWTSDLVLLLLLLLLLLLMMIMMMTTNHECLSFHRSHRVCHQRIPAAVQGVAGLAATVIATALA